MTLPSYLYGLGIGHDAADEDIAIFQNITATGEAKPYYPPVGYSNYRPGQRLRKTDGLVKIVGKPACWWTVGGATRSSLPYLSDTYCDGGVSGFVTVQTRIGRPEYKIFNAVMTLPDPADWDRIWKIVRNYRIDFTMLYYLRDVEEA